jgi:hypothetical protein
MDIGQLSRRVERLKAKYTPPPAVPVVRPMSAIELFTRVIGAEPDPWQAEVLTSEDPRIALNCSRQSGKSTVVAAKAISIALDEPKSLILLLAPSLRQSSELARKVFSAYQTVARTTVPAASETKLALELQNGSRILALPGSDDRALRGFSSVRALIIDEASRCSEALFVALRPMVAVSGGSILLLSTPFGKRGFFYRVWTESERWLKIQVTADQCPRLTPDFLAEEMIELGPRWYAQEYGCTFVEGVGQVFSDASIDAAFRDDVAPLFGDDDDGALVDLPSLFGER